MDALSTRNLERRVELKVNIWINRQRGKIVGEKRRQVYNDVPVEWINPDSDVGMEICTRAAQITTEDVLVVEIPVKELTTMAETQEWYQRNIGGYSMDDFNKTIRDGYFEEDLRKHHPGLQEAWEQYQIMLGLCSDKTYHK